VHLRGRWSCPGASWNGYDEARAIDEGEAREMTRRLAREEGVFAGVSTGLNVVGALSLARELGPGKTVVTVAVDTGLKYLSGDLYHS
jgi:cysteine synthase A